MNYKKPLFIALIVSGLFATACFDEPETFDPAAQFGIDTVKIDNYLASKGIVAEIDSLSRIRYVIVDEGTGATPDDTDSVTVNYLGRTLPDETKFDENDTVTFKLNGLISGWRIGIPLVKEGGSVQLFLPSYFGYRNFGSGSIPPNTCLRFDIDLIDVK